MTQSQQEDITMTKHEQEFFFCYEEQHSGLTLPTL